MVFFDSLCYKLAQKFAIVWTNLMLNKDRSWRDPMRFHAPQFACPFSPHCPTGALFPFFQFSSAVIVVSVLRRQKLLWERCSSHLFSKRLWIKCYLPLRRGRRFIHINLLQLRVRVAVLFNWFLDTRMKLANLTFFFPTYCEQLNASQEVVRTIWSQTCHERQRNREGEPSTLSTASFSEPPTLSITSLSVAFLNSIARMLIWLRLLRKHWIDKRTQPGLAEKTPTMRLLAFNGTFFPLKN